jgi:hypothetical protein
MVFVAFSSSAFSSSGEKMTYWAFSNSYPFAISSRSTTVPSLDQRYCCLWRAPSVLCTMLNETDADVSLEE